MSAAAPIPSSGLTAPTLPSPPTSIPWLGLLAVLMGTFISTLNGRLSVFGLADIRGAVGAGFDEGAWITTAQTVAQMFITLVAVWMGAAYGPRRVLIGASIAFAVISLLTPYSPTLPVLLALQFLGGLASGAATGRRGPVGAVPNAGGAVPIGDGQSATVGAPAHLRGEAAVAGPRRRPV